MTLPNLELNCCIFQCCYMDLSNLLYGFVKFVTRICQSFYRISHTFPFLFFESPAVQNVFLIFLLLLLFCSRDKKRSKNYVMHRFVSLILRSFFIVFVCKSPGIVSVRKKERPSSSSSNGRFVTLSVFLRLFAYNFSQPLCTFSKMIFLTGKLS